MATNQERGLGDRRFRPLFFTQFWGAFNDNLFKNALVLTIIFGNRTLAGLSPAGLVALSAGVFIVPFFLFSALAGELADKYPKAPLMRWTKRAEVAVALVAGAGFWLESLPILFAALFLMGLQSTFFGPLKYGALPELVSPTELVGGNALIEMGTFLAILLGTIAGGALMAAGAHGPQYAALAVLVIALIGLRSSHRIPTCAAAAPELEISRSLFRSTLALVRSAADERSVFYSILGISWFWLLGSVVLSVLPSLVTLHLAGSEAVVSYLLALFSIGVGVGSLLCKKLSFKKLELGLVPVGSLGITLFLLDAALAVSGHDPNGGTSIADLLTTVRGLRLTLDLSLFAVSSGLFIVPLYTLLQERSKQSVRARVIAANNVVNAAFMVGGSLFLTVLLALGVSIPVILMIAAAMNLAVAIYIYTVIPEFLFRFLCFCLAHVLYRIRIEGQHNIPSEGPAVLVSNHVTFVDWLVLAAATQRPIRFVMHHSFTRLPCCGRLFRDAKVIPIAGRKEAPEVLEAAFARIDRELEAGELVCIFPEGRLTLDGRIGPFRRGIERILQNRPVPVVALRLDGLWKSFFSRHVPRRPFRRVWSRVRLRIAAPVAPHAATAAFLEQSIAALGDSPDRLREIPSPSERKLARMA